MGTPITVPEPRLILASASPRRRELLAACGCPFEVRPADVDETLLPEESADDYVCRAATDKAHSIYQQFPDHFVLGCDTSVVLDERILGKPQDDAEAVAMLEALSDHTHQVLSAVVLLGPNEQRWSALSITEVVFAPLPAEWIAGYVSSGQGRDKAGSYGIQNEAGLWVSRINGSYSGVVGLPLFETAQLLRQAGLIGA